MSIENSPLKGALIGTTNLKMIDKVGKGLEVEITESTVVLAFDDVDYRLPMKNVESKKIGTYKTNGFTVLEIVTTKEIYYIAMAGI